MELSRLISHNSNIVADDAHRDSRRLKLVILATEYFFQELKSLSVNSDQITMVLDGDRNSIYNGYDNRKGYNLSVYNNFIVKSSESGISIIDLHPVFKNDFSNHKKHFNFPFDYHWNDYGHSIVAKQIIHSNLLIQQKQKGVDFIRR